MDSRKKKGAIAGTLMYYPLPRPESGMCGAGSPAGGKSQMSTLVVLDKNLVVSLNRGTPI